MHVSRVLIENYRNFKRLELSEIPQGVLLVGENGIGKSNFLRALRLVLDQELPDAERQLRQEDICEYADAQLADGVTVRIEVEIAGFEDNTAACGMLDGCIVSTTPMIARMTYLFRPGQRLGGSSAGVVRDDYEFVVFGGFNEATSVSRARRHLSLTVLPPLRDAAAELSRTARSPLLEILDATPPAPETLAATAVALDQAMVELRADKNMSAVAGRVDGLLTAMAGPQLGVTPSLGFTPNDPARLMRSVQLFVDANRVRTVGQDSTGTANVVLLALKMERMDLRQRAEAVVGTILAIEEPEAHLHPVLQRQLYRYLLRDRPALMLTTHSPNVAAVAPLESIVLLRRDRAGGGTVAVTAAGSNLDPAQRRDIERYLDVSRAELLFCRAAILVEGIAEVYLLPALARWFGFDLDAHGVVIASVAGTDFLPYRRLLGETALGVFHVVITDGDRSKKKGFDGLRRAQDLVTPVTRADLTSLLERLGPDESVDVDLDAAEAQPVDVDPLEAGHSEWQARLLAAADGVFVGHDTLELDIVSLLADSMIDAVCDLTSSAVTAENFAAAVRCMRDGIGLPQDEARIMNRIDDLGKGRFAQRLAARVDRAVESGLARVELDPHRILVNADDRLALLEPAMALGRYGYLLAALDRVSREVRGLSLFDSGLGDPDDGLTDPGPMRAAEPELSAL